MKAPRAYQGERDMQAMRELLMAGRAARNGSYYVHIGDLNWWLYRPPDEAQRRAGIQLWDSDQADGALLAWAYAPPGDGSLDVYVHPALHRTAQGEDILGWAVEWGVAQQTGNDKVQMHSVADTDAWLRPYFAKHGFLPVEQGDVHLNRSLASLPDAALPPGFQIISVDSEAAGVQRAQATYRAFNNTMPWMEYWERYRRFFASAAHIGERDLVVISPDGRGASACCIWFDEVNRVGLFEPVGTHPDFQRQGLGKAMMAEALRRMRAAGLESATVLTNNDNARAIALYQSLGFEIDLRMARLVKHLAQTQPFTR